MALIAVGLAACFGFVALAVDTGADKPLAKMSNDLPPTIVLFGNQDSCKPPGWDKVSPKWKSLGVKSIDLWIAQGQGHGYTNQEP